MLIPEGAVERLHEAGRRAVFQMSEEDWFDDNVMADEWKNFMSLASKEVTGSAFAPRPGQPHYELVEQLAIQGSGVLLAAVHVRRATAAGNESMLERTSPAPQPYGVSPRGAELLAAEWLRYLGGVNVQVTRASQDGGIDVTAVGYILQVKVWAGPVTVNEVRELAGVSALDGRRPVFFSAAGYTTEAVRFGEAMQMLLFTFDAENGTLSGFTDSARAASIQGLASSDS